MQEFNVIIIRSLLFKRQTGILFDKCCNRSVGTLISERADRDISSVLWQFPQPTILISPSLSAQVHRGQMSNKNRLGRNRSPWEGKTKSRRYVRVFLVGGEKFCISEGVSQGDEFEMCRTSVWYFWESSPALFSSRFMPLSRFEKWL